MFVFPNPAREYLHVQFTKPVNGLLQLTDPAGEVLYTSQLHMLSDAGIESLCVSTGILLAMVERWRKGKCKKLVLR
jgi:hypothetical protein